MYKDTKNIKIINIILLTIILLSGIAIRLYGAHTIPLTHDEKTRVEAARELSKEGKGILVFGHKETQNPPLLLYFIKISYYLFGESVFSTRIPSILLGSLTLIILFFMVSKFIDTKTALLVTFLSSFSQIFVGFSRLANEDGIILFFATCIIFLIEETKLRKNGLLLLCAGFFFGAGLLVKFTLITLLPAIFIYLAYQNKKSKFLNIHNYVFFILIIISIISPYLYWNIKNNFYDFNIKVENIDFFSFSMVPTALFLGEIFIYLLAGKTDAYILEITSMEYPFVNWVLGLICISGIFYSIKNRKNSFIFFLLIIFSTNYILYSFFRPRTGGGHYFHLDNFWWALILIIPGFTLGAAMLVDLSKKYKAAKYLVFIIIFYIIINISAFIKIKANCFIPRESMRTNEFLKYKDGVSSNPFLCGTSKL